jgi:hypothetical protein
MNKQRTCKLLNLEETYVEYVFLFGSTIYGTNTIDSDIDLMIILNCTSTHEYYKQLKQTLKTEEFVVNSRKQFHRLMLEQDEHNVSIYSYDVFTQLIHEHCVWLLFAMYANVDPVNENTVGLYSSVLNDPSVLKLFELRIPMLRMSVMNEVSRTWQKAWTRIVKEMDLDKGRKLFVYSFRYLHWAKQLVSHGKIYDYTDGNDIHKQVMDRIPLQSTMTLHEIYSDYEKELKKRFDEDLEQFKRHSSHRTLSSDNTSDYSEGNALKDLIHFIEFHDGNIECLTRWFSIQIVPLLDDIVQLFVNSEETSYNLPMANICNGLILDRSTLTVLAVPTTQCHPIIIPSFELESEKKNKYKTPSTLYMHYNRMNSVRYAMYMYNHEWKVSPLEYSTNTLSSEEYWKMWKHRNYLLPEDDVSNLSFIFEFCDNDLSLLSLVQLNRSTLEFNELTISEMKQYLIDNQLNWETCEFSLKNIETITINDSDPSTETTAAVVAQYLHNILRKDLVLFHPDLSKDPLAIRSIELTIEQNNRVYHRRFVFKFPASYNLQLLQSFLKDTIACYYLPNYIPKYISDAVFDLVRYSMADNAGQFQMDSDVLFKLGTNRFININEEGNAWYYIERDLSRTIKEVQDLLEHEIAAFQLFKNSSVQTLEEEFDQRTIDKGMIPSKQNDYLRCTKSAVYFLRKNPTWTALQLFQALDIKRAKKTMESIPSRNENESIL